MKRLLRDRSARLGLVIIAVLVLCAVFAGVLAPFPGDVDTYHLPRRLLGPSATNILGTDRMGGDIFSRLLFGARLTILIAVIATSAAVLIGVPVGLVAGYYNNRFSELLMRVSDVFLAVPQIVLAIAIAQTLGPAIHNVILALSITYWPFWARLVYAETRSIRHEVFIEAAIALGASPLRVMVLHVLPSIASSVIVRTTIGLGGTILVAAALGFLGLGPPPPSPEWGRMIAESRQFLPQAWWYAAAPGIAILLVVMGFNLLGDGLRDALDPKLSRGPMHPDLLAVDDISVSFSTESGIAHVLDAVSLTLRRGEIMGLVGESGCGKTTLARTILGALPPNARIRGTAISFDGRDLLTIDPREAASEIRGRAMTFVPQDPFSAFNPLFTVGDQISEAMRWKSPDRRPFESGYNRTRRRSDRDRALTLLRRVQLPDPERLLKKYPHELSGGQRQRLMIAMALLPEPRLVIADEPTTALDVTIQAQILMLLRQLAVERGVSVLLTTHDLGTAWEICDRVTVMYAGQALETAPIDAFFAAPALPYTRLLLDSLPSGDAPLRGIPGDVPSLVSAPPGCRFHPRCPSATEICHITRPPLSQPAPGHWVRCHHGLVA